MKIGRVIGNIWATRKDENLSGLKLLVVQPLNLLNDQPIDTPIVAADIIGAGVGEDSLCRRKLSAWCSRRSPYSGGCNDRRNRG